MSTSYHDWSTHAILYSFSHGNGVVWRNVCKSVVEYVFTTFRGVTTSGTVPLSRT